MRRRYEPGRRGDAGSGVLSCSYVGEQIAFCEGTLSLSDRSRVTASRYLDPNASDLSLAAITATSTHDAGSQNRPID